MSQTPFGGNPQTPFGNAPQNPYGSPQTSGMGPGQASEKVKIPAILLMVAGGIGIAMHILGLVMNLLGVGLGAAQGGDDGGMAIAQGVGGVIGVVIGLACDGVVIAGGLNMMKLQNWGLALAASIIALLPCISCGCLLGLPIGIWSLVILNDAQVKASFR